MSQVQVGLTSEEPNAVTSTGRRFSPVLRDSHADGGGGLTQTQFNTISALRETNAEL